MPDEASRDRNSLKEAVAGLATVILAILGLARVVPEFFVAIATIVYGTELLLRGSAIIAEYARIHNVRPGTAAAHPRDGGLSAELLAGSVGIVLCILALLRISTDELTPAIAIIAFGAALILSEVGLRVHLLRLPLTAADKMAQRCQRRIGE
jgi:hypothetical protein